MTAKKAPGPRTERALHLDGPPQGSIRAVAAAANIAKYQCTEGPHTESIMVAPGPLLAGVPRKHVKIRACWAAVFFLICPPTECILGQICGIAFLRGSLKCVVEARSPQIVGLGSVVNSDVLV